MLLLLELLAVRDLLATFLPFGPFRGSNIFILELASVVFDCEASAFAPGAGASTTTTLTRFEPPLLLDQLFELLAQLC